MRLARHGSLFPRCPAMCLKYAARPPLQFVPSSAMCLKYSARPHGPSRSTSNEGWDGGEMVGEAAIG
eukprot:1747817-Prorocentrum_lima.AAC.1